MASAEEMSFMGGGDSTRLVGQMDQEHKEALYKLSEIVGVEPPYDGRNEPFHRYDTVLAFNKQTGVREPAHVLSTEPLRQSARVVFQSRIDHTSGRLLHMSDDIPYNQLSLVKRYDGNIQGPMVRHWQTPLQHDWR